MGDPPWPLVVLTVIAIVAVNTLGYRAMKRGAVGNWFSPTVGLASLAVLLGADHSMPAVVVGLLALVALGAYGGMALQRLRAADSHE
jgi:hypothetical protein